VPCFFLPHELMAIEMIRLFHFMWYKRNFFCSCIYPSQNVYVFVEKGKMRKHRLNSHLADSFSVFFHLILTDLCFFLSDNSAIISITENIIIIMIQVYHMYGSKCIILNFMHFIVITVIIIYLFYSISSFFRLLHVIIISTIVLIIVD